MDTVLCPGGKKPSKSRRPAGQPPHGWRVEGHRSSSRRHQATQNQGGLLQGARWFLGVTIFRQCVRGGSALWWRLCTDPVLYWWTLVRAAGGVLRPADWSLLKYSENLMLSLVGLGHRERRRSMRRQRQRLGHDHRPGGQPLAPHFARNRRLQGPSEGRRGGRSLCSKMSRRATLQP